VLLFVYEPHVGYEQLRDDNRSGRGVKAVVDVFHGKVSKKRIDSSKTSHVFVELNETVEEITRETARLNGDPAGEDDRVTMVTRRSKHITREIMKSWSRGTGSPGRGERLWPRLVVGRTSGESSERAHEDGDSRGSVAGCTIAVLI
jgi:hypothetical protein